MSGISRTYCNPLPLENYPRGRGCRAAGYAGPSFREMADPTVIFHQGRWYLFPSAGMLWHSDDLVRWMHHPIEPFDPGYAPTVVAHQGWLYLTASWDGSAIWRARDPLGPWERIGVAGRDEDGNETWLRDHQDRPVRWGDPCLFVDDDGSLYCYCNLMRPTRPEDRHPWRLINREGICAVRLNEQEPFRFAEAPRVVLEPDPVNRPWEGVGEYNQRFDHIILEGAWVNKIGGRYYLQCSSNGTEYRNYAVAAYVADRPTGPFIPQRHNPILQHRGGLLNGCGHHSLVAGPGGTLWCFYTILVRIHADYERRIAMDPAGLDAQGEMIVAGPSETPQHAPGLVADPLCGNDLGLVPLSVHAPARASSTGAGRPAAYAVDNGIRTWWQAADASCPQWLEVDLQGEFLVSSARTLFADAGLDYPGGITPGPYAYRIHGSRDGQAWDLLCDRARNNAEQHIVFDTWEPRLLRHVRLEITAVPAGMTAAVWEFTVFGLPQAAPARPSARSSAT